MWYRRQVPSQVRPFFSPCTLNSSRPPPLSPSLRRGRTRGILAKILARVILRRGEWPESRGGSRIFFRRGCTRLLLYFNTNKQHSFFFCCRIPVVLENRRSSQGAGGGAHPLHPPPRSAPGISTANCKCVRPTEALIYMRCGE